MDKFDLLTRIAKKEDYHTEFKATLPDTHGIAKYIVCLANTDGGQLIIGVSDKGEILGLDDLDKSMLSVDDVAYHRCHPPITVIQETVSIDNKTVLIINIPKGNQRPYHTDSGQYYIRASNRCRQASREELLRLFQASESIYFDEMAMASAHISDLDLDYFQEFLEKYLHTQSSAAELENYLKNMHLIDSRNRPTLAGILFFGKDPQKFFPNYRLIASNIKGDDISIAPTDKKDIKGKIPGIISDIQNFFKLYLAEIHQIKGFESELTFEVPEAALREAIINAIAHRDYTIEAPIRAIIFQDRIEIHTPGKLPNSVTIESMKIGGSHVLRNPTIYNLLSKTGMVTDLGSGVRRMIQLMKQQTGMDIILQELDYEFLVVIPRKMRA